MAGISAFFDMDFKAPFYVLAQLRYLAHPLI